MLRNPKRFQFRHTMGNSSSPPETGVSSMSDVDKTSGGCKAKALKDNKIDFDNFIQDEMTACRQQEGKWFNAFCI